MRMWATVVFAAVFSVVSSLDHHEHEFGEAADVEDEVHIREHMEEKIDLPPHIEKVQARFLYFEMCDLNKDDVIDGNEILKSMTHGHEQGSRMPGNIIDDEEEIIKRIDRTLADMDFDGNGLITFSEFYKHQEIQHSHFNRRKNEH